MGFRLEFCPSIREVRLEKTWALKMFNQSTVSASIKNSAGVPGVGVHSTFFIVNLNLPIMTDIKDTIHCAGDRLYLAGIHASRRLDELNHLNVTHVITVLDKENIEILQRSREKESFDIVYNYLVLDDNDDNRFFDVMRRGYDIICAILEEERHVVLVHCEAGVSRSSSLVLYYQLMDNPTLNLEDALRELVSRRRVVAPNYWFHRHLTTMFSGRPAVCEHKQTFELSVWAKDIGHILLHDDKETSTGHSPPFMQGITVHDTKVWRCCIGCRQLVDLPSWSVDQWKEKIGVGSKTDSEDEMEEY